MALSTYVSHSDSCVCVCVCVGGGGGGGRVIHMRDKMKNSEESFLKE